MLTESPVGPAVEACSGLSRGVGWAADRASAWAFPQLDPADAAAYRQGRLDGRPACTGLMPTPAGLLPFVAGEEG